MKVRTLLNKASNSAIMKKALFIAIIFFCTFYTFSIPSFSGNRFYLISYLAMAALIAVTTCYYLLYEKKVFDKRILWLLLFVFETFIGTAIFSHVFRRWLSIILMSITFIVFYYSFRCLKDPYIILRIFVASFLMFALFFAIKYKTNVLHPHLSQRIGDYFDNVNLIGTYFSLASMLSVYLALFLKKKIAFLYFAPALVFIYFGLLTGSRQFLITTTISLLLVIYLRLTKKKWIFFVVLLSFIGLFAILINLPFMSYYKEMISRAFASFGIGDSRTDASVIERVIWQQYGFVLGSKNILFGYGAEGFGIYSSIGTYSHNNYSELLCDFGIFGLMLFYLPLIIASVIAIRSKKIDLKIILPIAVFYFVKAVFGVYYYYKDYYVMLALCLFLASPYSFGNHRTSLVIHKNRSFEEVAI